MLEGPIDDEGLSLLQRALGKVTSAGHVHLRTAANGGKELNDANLRPVGSRCGAVTVGLVCLLPPLSSAEHVNGPETHLFFGTCGIAHHDPGSAHAYFVNSPHRARASRSSRSFGGLQSTMSTCAGTSPSVMSRWPQPVSRITGVEGDAAFTKPATWRPST